MPRRLRQRCCYADMRMLFLPRYATCCSITLTPLPPWRRAYLPIFLSAAIDAAAAISCYVDAAAADAATPRLMMPPFFSRCFRCCFAALRYDAD